MLKKGWQGPFPVLVAVVIVASLSLLTVTVMSGFGPEEDDLAVIDTEGTPTSSTTTTTSVRRTTTTTTRPTTTTAPGPGTEAPEVLGETTAREPDASTATVAPTTAAPSTTAPPAPAFPSAPAPAPTTTEPAPTTTTTRVCRNSTDPACGPLVWDPSPGAYDVEVYAVSAPTNARVGREVVFAVNRVEPAGTDALGACTSWQVSDPGVVSTSSCEAVNADCGRYGPHDPPSPRRREVTLSHRITFTEPGEHTVRISGNTATHLADGCHSPYLESWSRTFTVIVGA